MTRTDYRASSLTSYLILLELEQGRQVCETEKSRNIVITLYSCRPAWLLFVLIS